jgi:hypothetical protein
MLPTIVADHLESVLFEIENASKDIEASAAHFESTPDEIGRFLLQALETARQVLESALNRAEQDGLPRLAIDAA